jgi:hypothetical protein
MPSWLQRTIGKASAKVPGWDYQQTEYLDEFGNTESSGPLGWRVIENLISPGYWNKSHESDEMYSYLQTIHDETGTDYYPSTNPPSTINSGGEKYKLSQDEKEQYQKTRGETYTDSVEELLKMIEDSNVSYDEQAEILKDIKSYSSSVATQEYLQSQGVDYTVKSNTWTKALNALDEANISFVTFYEYDALVSNLKSTKKEDVLEIIDSLDITSEQKDYLYYLNRYAESTINNAPWHTTSKSSK